MFSIIAYLILGFCLVACLVINWMTNNWFLFCWCAISLIWNLNLLFDRIRIYKTNKAFDKLYGEKR